MVHKSQLMNYCVHEDELLPHNCLGQQTHIDQLVAKRKASSKQGWKLGISLIVFLLICCLVLVFCRDHLEEFLNWLEGLPQWQSGLLFVFLFTVISFPGMFGYLVLNIAAGYMYGFWVGMLVVFISVVTGSIISFLVSRQFLNGFIQGMLDSDDNVALKTTVKIIDGSQGLKVIALTRLTPVPFGLQNGLFAISNVTLLKYTLATVVGLLPTQILNTYLGTTLRSMKDVIDNDGDSYIMFMGQLLVSVVLMGFVVRLARTEINKSMSAAESGRDLEAGDGYKKGHNRSKSASAVLMSKQKIINQPSQFR